MEYRYIKDDFNTNKNYFPVTLSETPVVESYGILKDFYVCNIKYRMMISIIKLLSIEPHNGFGIRYRVVSNVGRTYDGKPGKEFEYSGTHLSIGDFEERTGFKLNISIGLKPGIRL